MDGPGSGENLAPKLDELPRRPGIYRFLNARGDTIYVGKAKSLRSRGPVQANFTLKKPYLAIHKIQVLWCDT